MSPRNFDLGTALPNYPACKDLKNKHLPFLHIVNFLSICQDLIPQPETNQIQCHIHVYGKRLMISNKVHFDKCRLIQACAAPL